MKKLYKAIAIILINLTSGLSFRFLEKVRCRLYIILGAKIGSGVKIKSRVIIEYPSQLIIGNNSSIQHNCYISAYGGVEIGSNVSIAHGVSILSSTHPINKVEVIKNAPLTKMKVVIKDNIWIGMKSSIVGVEINSGAVIGAHTFVNRDILENEVVGGTPVKHLKYRVV